MVGVDVESGFGNNWFSYFQKKLAFELAFGYVSDETYRRGSRGRGSSAEIAKHVAPRGDFARSRASPAPVSSSSRCSSSRLGTREKSDAPPLSAPRPLLSHPPALRREFPERLDGHQPRVLLRRLHGVRGGTHRRGFRGVSLKLRDERGGARAAAVSPPVSPPFLESAPVTAAATREACSSQTATSAASEGMRPRRYL